MNSKEFLLFCFYILLGTQIQAQEPDKIYKPYIATAQLFQYGNQQQLPVYRLNSGDRFQLEFDDLEGNYKNYYYTYQLCNYNWIPVNLSPFDYIKGFTQNRITTTVIHLLHLQDILIIRLFCLNKILCLFVQAIIW